MQNKITYIFHVDGMHCKSCSLVIERELSDLSYVESVTADISKNTVTVTGDFEGIPQEAIAKDFSTLLSEHGYIFSVEKLTTENKKKNWEDFKIALPIALGFMVLFILLQKTGFVNLINAEKINYGTAFLIGVIASISSCAAVIGGIVLSMSATFAKGGDKVKPQALFHFGRLISFFVFGGVIGMIGLAFTLNTTLTFILNLIIGLAMLVLGINLLDVFDFAKKLQPGMPKFLSKHALSVSKFNHSFTPFLVGVVTFFLPCGFTQSMQIYTLSTGSFFSGGKTMLAFALGTFPALAIISFSSLGVGNSSKSSIFFKTAGLIVIIFALFSFINNLVIMGILPPVFHF